jgi:HlyD family type I secretion membrane fusion protein
MSAIELTHPAAAAARPRRRFAGPILLGHLLIVGFFGLFTLWAVWAPLERAAMATGSVVVEGSRRQIQHLEGGIVERILVHEGALVEAGQPVILLDATVPRTQVAQLAAQLAASEAQIARLRAEAENADAIAPHPADEALSPEAAALVASQGRIFELRRDAMRSQIELLGQRSRQSREEILGLRAEIVGQDRQLELIDREIATVRGLLERGLEREPRLLALERTRAEVVGARAQNFARIARVEQVIVENDMRALDLGVQTMSEAAQKLRDEEVRAAELRDRLHVARDAATRTTITAPVSGKVVNLKVFTERGTINPRESVMEIVPRGERLVIDAQIQPGDVDILKIGAPVRVRFSSLPQRDTPVVDGRLDDVAADRQSDPRSGASFYTARISLPPAQIERLGAPVVPGMPVEVTVNAGARSLVEYLLMPLAAWHFRAMKER